jgi:hypothetical protein
LAVDKKKFHAAASIATHSGHSSSKAARWGLRNGDMDMNDLESLFTTYWWLIFPVFWMVYGVVRMALRDSYERRRLNLIRALAEQGRDIPDVLRR